MKVKLLIIAVFIAIGCSNKAGNQKCNPRKEEVVSLKKNIETVRIIDECKNNFIVSEQEIMKLSKDSSTPNGYYKDFYPDGKIRTIGYFKMGVQDSIGIRYFNNGNKETSNFYSENGQLSGAQYSFHPNGNIKFVNFCKNDTSIWCTIEYDSNAKVIGFKGYPLKILAKPGFKNIKVGGELALINEVAVVDNMKTTLSIKLTFNGKPLVDTAISNFIRANNTNFMPFVEILRNKGAYTYSAVAKLYEQDKTNINLVKEHKTEYQITVK